MRIGANGTVSRGHAWIRRNGYRAPVPLLLLLPFAVAVTGQSRERGGNADAYCYTPDACPRAAYDGRFTFARVYFEAGGRDGAGLGSFRGFRGSREPPWHHDRPFAERNLSSILREISYLRTFDGAHGGNVFGLDDPEIYRYPVLWVAEPGVWVPSDAEAEALGDHLRKGGFAIFDDFSGPQDWRNFELQMRRVLPDLTPIRLTGEEPIFRSFFDIDLAGLQLNFNSRNGEYWGYFEGNDRTQRQLAMVNFNNDIGEFMEYSATGFYAVDLANEAYKLATNYIMYALTH